MKFVFVILHYLATEDTIKCIESILGNLDYKNIEIIVVDNASPNGSIDKIENYFINNKKVTIIRSEKNLGFARGNNLGFLHAKYHLSADFIILVNNDTIITQKNFCQVALEKYNEYRYYILGPDIITLDGYHQNPLIKASWSFKELKLFRLKKRIRLVCTYLKVDNLIDNFIKEVKDVHIKDRLEGDFLNTALHGACFIFSKDYIDKFEGLNGDTFLYMEEDILKLYADYYNFLMMYSSDLSILHKEDIATNMVSGSTIGKKRNLYRRLIESSVVYEKIKRNMSKNEINT